MGRRSGRWQNIENKCKGAGGDRRGTKQLAPSNLTRRANQEYISNIPKLRKYSSPEGVAYGIGEPPQLTLPRRRWKRERALFAAAAQSRLALAPAPFLAQPLPVIQPLADLAFEAAVG